MARAAAGDVLTGILAGVARRLVFPLHLPRPLGRAALALFVGAAVNVAVAWSIAATRYPLKPQQAPAPGWHCQLPGRSTWTRYTGASPGIVYFKEIYHSAEGLPRAAHSVASGWPALSVVTTWLTDDRARRVRSSFWRQGIALPRWFEQKLDLLDATDSHLPIRPVLPGFLLNTLLYAAPLLIPLAYLEVRHWRARRAGCPRCGYDTTGLTRCPECGAPIRISTP